MPKPIGPSRLSQILQKLNSDPKPVLTPSLKSIKLTYAAQNDHFGARYFVKQDLRRIRYANPKTAIEISKFPKTEADTWQSSLLMEFEDGSKKSFSMDDKSSTTIFVKLMDTAGTPAWDKWKADRKAANLPIVDDSQELKKQKPSSSSPSPKAKTGAAAVLP